MRFLQVPAFIHPEKTGIIELLCTSGNSKAVLATSYQSNNDTKSYSISHHPIALALLGTLDVDCGDRINVRKDDPSSVSD